MIAKLQMGPPGLSDLDDGEDRLAGCADADLRVRTEPSVRLQIYRHDLGVLSVDSSQMTRRRTQPLAHRPTLEMPALAVGGVRCG